MIAKRLLVGLAALGLPLLAVVVVEGPSSVRAQQQPPFPIPHGGYGDDTEICAVCHDWHPSPNPDRLTEAYTGEILPPETEVAYPWEGLLVRQHERDVCYMCHDGSASSTNIEEEFRTDTRVSWHPVHEWKDDVLLVCSDCHAEHQDPAEDVMLLYRETSPGTYVFSPPSNPIGDTFCYGCHGSTSTLPPPFGDHAAFETSIHNTDGDVEPPTPGTDLKCSACHEPHASDYAFLTRDDQEALCYTCHSGADPNTANGSNPEDDFTRVANDTTTGDGNGIRIYHHPVAEAEQANGARTVECASCHNSHLVNRTETASDPARPRQMDSGWRFNWDTSSNGLYNRGTDVTPYCGTCHVSPTTIAPLVADLVNIPYDVNLVNDAGTDADGEPHDKFDLTWYRTGGDSAHGNPSFAPSDYLGCPPGGDCELACTACHDFHGSSNAYMLREDIVSPDYEPLQVLNAVWTPGQGNQPGEVTLTVGAHRFDEDWWVVVSGVTPSAYDGLYRLTAVSGTEITYELEPDPGPYAAGGTVEPRGVDSARSYTSTIVNFGGLDTASDRNKLQTMCLTCHLEQTASHQGGKLCTQCHNHSPSSSREF